MRVRFQADADLNVIVLLAEFITTQTSAGVLVVPQHLPIATAVEDLLLVWAATEAEEWTNRICYLPL